MLSTDSIEHCCHKNKIPCISIKLMSVKVKSPFPYSLLFSQYAKWVVGRHFVDEEIEAQRIMTFSTAYLSFKQAIINQGKYDFQIFEACKLG